MAVTSEPQAGTTGQAENIGRIEEIQGVVIEAVFPAGLPEINNAILVRRTGANRDELQAGGDTASETPSSSSGESKSTSSAL